MGFLVVGGFGHCWGGAGGALGATGMAAVVRRTDRMSTFLVISLMVLVKVRICFCVSSSRFSMS